jgi:hypothetical protein
MGMVHPIYKTEGLLSDLGYKLVEKDPDVTFILSDHFKNDTNKHLLDKHYPAVILDTQASTGTHKFKMMDKAVFYIKKQLLKDMELYRIKYPRSRYHYYQIALSNPDQKLDTSTEQEAFELDKERIFLGWNLGLVKRFGIRTNKPFKWGKKDIDIHFSIKVRYREYHEKTQAWRIQDHYTYHRHQCTRLLGRIAKKRKYKLSGPCRKEEYLEKMSRSVACFSPLGLGEICFRDFEAISCGALLVKPDMSHLTTWPDVYRPWETYIPVKWDLSDLDEVLNEVLKDPNKYSYIAENAYKVLQNARNNETFAARFDAVMKEIPWSKYL